MNLSIPNIAWLSEYNMEICQFMKEQGFTWLEIAPTRLFPQNPYDYIVEAKKYAIMLKDKYGLCISSIQSIWFGKNENIFGTDEESP